MASRSKRSARTIDVVYRFDLTRPARRPGPRSAVEALGRLERGNRSFATLLDGQAHGPRIIPVDPGEVGHGPQAGLAPTQRPFAAVLGCADARVPVEMVFQQRANDLFVVRVAGNGLGSGCLGSLRYAASNFAESLRLVLVLGHSQCGAVSAAVDAFLKPKNYLSLAINYPLRAIVDSILVAVRTASVALETAHGPDVARQPGYRAALVEVSVAVNAALAAFALREELGTRRCRVVFGAYDLASRLVRLPLAPPGRSQAAEIGLLDAPTAEDEFRRLVVRLAGSGAVAALLPAGHRRH